MLTHIRSWLLTLIALLALALVAGCGSGSGADVTSVAASAVGATSGPVYTGPAPRNEDVQRFRINLWDNINSVDRCGRCHTNGEQDPAFARFDDVNLAYDIIQPFVDLSVPADSALVAKVRGGHNCWLGDPADCADFLITWIQNWAGDAGSSNEGGVRRVAFSAPPDRAPGDSKSFPADSSLFSSTVYPVLRTYCAECHSDAAAIAIRPYFASADVDAAYTAARSLINLDTPADARFVRRLGSEFHNCWSDCPADANTMANAITAMADAIPLTQLDPDLVTSQALSLPDGIVASGGGRFDASAVALYQFKTGSGSTAFDTSGLSPAINLSMTGEIDWVGGWGIALTGGKAQASTASSRRLHQALTASGEFSIEAWAAPANVTQEAARLVSYSGGTTLRNMGLHQTLYNYDALVRDANTDANASPAFSTDDDNERAQATLQHVVLTYGPATGRRLYVDGNFTEDLDPEGGASLTDWDDSFALVLGNEVSSDRPWAGTLRLVAIHNRALTPEQIQQNFDAGVGERFFLLFGIADQVGEPGAYIVFEVSRFDNWAYLFSAPFYIDLDGGPTSSFALAGVRIGINGREAAVGQTFAALDTQVDPAAYVEGEGQTLSSQATIIALEKGPELDEFFLTFERLGSLSNVLVEAAPPPPAAPVDLDPAPDLGLRTFDEINATLAKVTGVPRTQADVAETFATVRQQLPVVSDVDGFLSSHQMAVTQLAIEYCNALVDDSSLRASTFPGFNFTATAAAAFDTSGRAALIDPLLSRTLHSGLTTQPDAADTSAELNELINRLTSCAGSCAAGRTEIVAKAVCAAAVGSATLLLQ